MADLQVSILASEGKATVGSRQLAEHFGIQHRNVTRDIRAILRKVPEEWGALNFEQTPYTDPQNGQTYPAFNLTRDGFTLLAMGYNSARAIAWKIRYIEAFNALEKIALDAASAATARAVLDLLPSDRLRMKKILAYRARGFSCREIAAVTGDNQRRVGHMLSKARKLGLGA